jgi:cold shock CspA family protein
MARSESIPTDPPPVWGARRIATDDGTADVFVRHSAIDMGGFRTLPENQKVEYTVSQAPRARRRTRSTRSD